MTSGDSAPVSIVFAGLGGQGVLKASDIAAEAAFRSGYDIKKSELHGMSQRGGSVSSDVRFGRQVFSPMAPAGEADFMVVIAPGQVEVNQWRLRAGGILISPDAVDQGALSNKKTLNVALLGLLSNFVEIPEEHWLEAIRANVPSRFLDANLAAFALGRRATHTELTK
ncbi:MAG: 2-oxoacid:acceptor oxidoreductase family protein [Bryobacteraceae bacterium]